MSGAPDLAVRHAEASDAETIGQLLHDFNGEFEEPTPGPRVLAERVRQLLAAGEITVLLGGGEPHGVAVLRFRSALWHKARQSRGQARPADQLLLRAGALSPVRREVRAPRWRAPTPARAALWRDSEGKLLGIGQPIDRLRGTS